MSKRRAMEQVGWLGDGPGGDDDSDKEIKEDVAMSPPSKASRVESDSCAGDSTTTKRVEKEEEQGGGENLMRVYQWWPTKSHQFQVTFRMNVGEDDTLFTALAIAAPSLFQPAAQVTLSHYPTIPTSGQQIRAELAGFGTGNAMWTEYCHHIYIQHQKSCSQLRFTDLTTANQAQHFKAKEIYMEYMSRRSGCGGEGKQDMPSAPGSLLELIFASLKYKMNSIVLQFIPDKSHFVAYNFNPQWCRRRAYFVNVGEPEGGKWRNLSYLGLSSGSSLILGGAGNETLPLLQSGVYKTEGADVERTVLELRMLEAGVDGNKGLVACNLQLFSRLLTGTARPDELTLVLAKGEHDDDEEEEDQLVTITPKSVEYILPPRQTVDGLGDKSSFAFKSIQNLADCKEWCKRITQAQEPRVVQVNPFISRQPHDSITVPFLLGPNDHLVRPVPAAELTSAPEAKAELLGQVDDEDERSGNGSLEFSPIENNSAVQVAILGLNRENGLEEIMLKFGQGGELFQRANHNLFFNVIVKSRSSGGGGGKSSPIQLELLNPETDQYEPAAAAASERPHESFRVDKGTTFHLFNPARPTIQLRCAWFPSQ